MSGHSKKVVVVGAGIVGASIAFHLATRGANVTLIDSGASGSVATAHSFAWVNATYGNPKPYFDLRVRSMQAWDDLAREFPKLAYRRTGTLYVDFDGVDIEAFAANHSAWGYDIRLIDPEQARQYEPAVKELSAPIALAEHEGAVEATAAAQFFAQAVTSAGGAVLTGVGIDGITVNGAGNVCGVLLNGQPLAADEVVVAAGVASPGIVNPLGINIPLDMPPGLLVHTKPYRHLIDRTIIAKDLHVRQRADGVLIAGADFRGGDIEENAETGAARLLQTLRKTLNDAQDVELERVTIGHRPTPKDGFPIIGRPADISGIYIAVMHSGVTLAPIVGALCCSELLDGKRDQLLALYGVDRFTET